MQHFTTSDKILMLKWNFELPSEIIKHIFGGKVFIVINHILSLFLDVVIIFTCQGASLEIKTD